MAKRGAGGPGPRGDSRKPGSGSRGESDRRRPAREPHGHRERKGKPGRSGTPARTDGPPRQERGFSGPPPRIAQDNAVLYGRNAIYEALRARRRQVFHIWVTESAQRSLDWLHPQSELLGSIQVELARGEELSQIAGSEDHQGVVAEVGAYPYVELSQLLAKPNPFLVALDEVQDPQNLGSIARTAECVGADGLIICRHRAAEVTASAAKASAGAVEHLQIAQVRNLADALTEAKEVGCWTYGAAGGSEISYDSPDYTGGVVLVMGAEGSGLRPRVEGCCDQVVSLPLRGQIESLNVSTSASVLMYEILQQREKL